MLQNIPSVRTAQKVKIFQGTSSRKWLNPGTRILTYLWGRGIEECNLVHCQQAFRFQTSPPALLLPEGQGYHSLTRETAVWALGYTGHFWPPLTSPRGCMSSWSIWKLLSVVALSNFHTSTANWQILILGIS